MGERFIRASELGEYEFCVRAWWLARVVGRERENPQQLTAGRERHIRHGHSLTVAAIMQQVGLILVLTSIIVTFLLALSGGLR